MMAHGWFVESEPSIVVGRDYNIIQVRQSWGRIRAFSGESDLSHRGVELFSGHCVCQLFPSLLFLVVKPCGLQNFTAGRAAMLLVDRGRAHHFFLPNMLSCFRCAFLPISMRSSWRLCHYSPQLCEVPTGHVQPLSAQAVRSRHQCPIHAKPRCAEQDAMRKGTALP